MKQTITENESGKKKEKRKSSVATRKMNFWESFNLKKIEIFLGFPFFPILAVSQKL